MNRAAATRTDWIDDPMTTRALKLAALDKSPNDMRAGQIRADRNMQTLIGGFAAFRGASMAQRRAAERFKNAFDNGQVGGTKAVVLQERVQGGGVSPELAFIIGDEARKDWAFAQKTLDKFEFIVLEHIIIHERSVRDIAKMLPKMLGGEFETARKKAGIAVYKALDKLAVGWGLATKE